MPPLKEMVPLSGECKPINDFKNTVFPEPLCPIIKLVFPGLKVVEIPFKTCIPLNPLYNLSTIIIM
jgi:hypothetical protein